MAVVGAIVTLLLACIAIFAEWVVPVDPTYQELHHRFGVPGQVHDTTPERLFLVEGERTSFPPLRYRGKGTRHFRFLVQQRIATGVHVHLSARSKKVRKIQLTRIDSLPESVERIEVRGDREVFRHGKGEEEVTVLDKEIVLGEKLDDVFLPLLSRASRGRQKLVLNQVVRAETNQTLTFDLESDQTVRGLRIDNQTVATYDLVGRLVQEVRRDGKPFQHRHLLGQDMHGRDLFSRLVFGARISFLIGVVATLVSLFIGVFYGAVAGWVGGRVDSFMMRVVDILYGIPYMFLVIILMTSFGRDVRVMFIALGAVQWLTMARIVRGQVLSLKEKEYIEAARASGGGGFWILTRHLIPNTLGVIAVYTTLTIPSVILQESFLSFLGLSPEWQGQPLESWGALTWNGIQALGTGQNWWLLVFPAMTLAITLFSMNFLGDGLRDAFDPQMKGRT
jgi:oligopeptide transport system permease protein